jgi:L-ascorbate metabolism protein UlaG (beta-lactamase superfamily)
MVENAANREVSVQLVGGPTAVVTYGGLRFLTDPTFDPPGDYDRGPTILRKLAGPAIPADRIGPVDAVLLSHDHHADNLDRAGREFLSGAGRTLTTRAGAERLGGSAVGLEPYETVEVPRPQGGPVRVTAVPAEHGDAALAPRNGPVIGFVLQAAGAPTVYVSGDNASVDVVQGIVDRLGPIPVAVLFTGAANVPEVHGDVHVTLTAENAVRAAHVLGAEAVIPIHNHGWRHFTETAGDVRDAFATAGLTGTLLVPAPGETVSATPTQSRAGRR